MEEEEEEEGRRSRGERGGEIKSDAIFRTCIVLTAFFDNVRKFDRKEASRKNDDDIETLVRTFHDELETVQKEHDQMKRRLDEFDRGGGEAHNDNMLKNIIEALRLEMKEGQMERENLARLLDHQRRILEEIQLRLLLDHYERHQVVIPPPSLQAGVSESLPDQPVADHQCACHEVEAGRSNR